MTNYIRYIIFLQVFVCFFTGSAHCQSSNGLMPVNSALTAGYGVPRAPVSRTKSGIPGNFAKLKTPDRAVETINQLVASTNTANGQTIAVLGYHASGDGGGGRFYYDSASEATTNLGSVFASSLSNTGRWIRWIQKNEPIRAEFFGARGNATHDDLGAIKQCLEIYNRIDFLPKTYLVGDFVPLKNNTKIKGAGKNATILRIVDHCAAAARSSSWLSVLQNYDFYVPANEVQISDLTLDCNYNNQPAKRATMNAIVLRGSGGIIERVKCINFGAGTNGNECFVVSANLVSGGQPSRKGVRIQECEFTQPGSNAGIAYPRKVPEITCLAFGGDAGKGSTNYSEGDLIQYNFIHDLRRDDQNQRSEIHGITSSWSSGAKIISNSVVNIDGVGIYRDSWGDKNALIAGNYLTNLRCGIALHVVNSASLENFKVLNNKIYLYRAAPQTHMLAFDIIGIDIFGPHSISGLAIRDNLISGKTITQGNKVWSPIGIRILNANEAYRKITVENNLLDVPEYSPRDLQTASPALPGVKPYPRAILHYFDYNYSANRIQIAQNKNLRGDPVDLTLLNASHVPSGRVSPQPRPFRRRSNQ